MNLFNNCVMPNNRSAVIVESKNIGIVETLVIIEDHFSWYLTETFFFKS